MSTLRRAGFVLISLMFGIGHLSAGAADVAPNNDGPIKVQSASWLGSDFDDELVGTAILEDGSILVAGNAVRLDWGKETAVVGTEQLPREAALPADKKLAKDWRHPDTFGFVAKLSPDGTRPLHMLRFGRGAATVRRMRTGGDGAVYLLADAVGELKVGGSAGVGTMVVKLSDDGTDISSAIFHEKASDFGVDSNGDVVILTKGHLTRFDAGGKQKWDATWKTFGDNRAGGVGVSPTTGVAAVVGYGMTNTGKEPYKDPFAYAFDRGGKQIWMLWNPDPAKEVAAKYGGNGLMADTTGRSVGVDSAGDFYLTYYSDGGNSVCTRDPLNVDAPIAPAVHEGVFQKGPGYGFKGASQTSAVFRVDPTTGTVKKGTWMCAWLTPARANGLRIEEATGNGKGMIAVVGGSAQSFKALNPWYQAPEGGYQGGGFLAVFDAGFKLQQAGYFPGTGVRAVAQRNGTIVVVGSAGRENKAKPDGGAEFTYPVPTYKAVQPMFGGGEKDGYLIVLKAQ